MKPILKEHQKYGEQLPRSFMAGRREGQAFLLTTANLSLNHVSEQRVDRGSNRGRIQFLHDSHDSVTIQKKQFSKASLRT